MKTIKKIAVVLNVFLFCMPFSFSQWTSVNPSVTGPFQSMYFFDSMNGMAAGLLNAPHTTNGGSTWTLHPAFDLTDIDFASSTIGYATGVSGSSLQKTTNGGVSWSTLTPLASNSMWGVSVIDANTFFVCGTAGVVWKSINGGTSFSACDLPNTSWIATDLQFFSATTGCVVTGGGEIYRTTNAGTSWTLAFGGVLALSFHAIYFPDANNGYAVGTGGSIYKSTDAGVSWTQQTSGTPNELQDVHFYDVNNGIVCGNVGTVVRTTNGGLTWTTDATTGTTSTLDCCWMLSPSSAIAGGENNTLIKTTHFSAIEDGFEEYSRIQVFPNPSMGIVNITSEKEINAVRIYNPLGELIHATVSPSHNLIIELQDKVAGIYLVEVEMNGKKYIKKLICN
jgi:photosystem II stability/assembly factor-like uncharacterized protein